MAAWSNLAGTVTGFLRLGLSGVRLKNSAGELAVRNAGDTADAKIQIADGTAANHAVSKGQADVAYAPTLLVDYTVPAVTTSVVFSGLDLLVHKGYRVEVDYGDGANTTHGVFMYVNGLTADADYYSQFVHGDGASVAGGRANSGNIFAADANNRTKAGIDIYGVDTFLMATSVCARTIGAGLKMTTYSWARTAPTANITSLTFTAGVANGIASGSRFRIYRKDK